jgi:hypothetical protein
MRTIIGLVFASLLTFSTAAGLAAAAGQFASDFATVARIPPPPEHPACDGNCPNPAFVAALP